MWNAHSRTSKRAGRRPIAPAGQDRRARLETLERRCLLSGTGADTPAVQTLSAAPVSAALLGADDGGFSRQEFDATGTFSGELRLRRRDEEGRRVYAMTLRITSQDESGNVSGTIGG